MTPVPDTAKRHVANVAKGLQLPRPAPPKPNGAQLILNRGLGNEKRTMLDLNGLGLIRPLVSIDTGRTNRAGQPTVRVKLEVDLVNGGSCVVFHDPIRFRLGRAAEVTVSLVVDGVETPIMSAALDPAGDPNTMFGLPLTADDLLLSLLPRETAVHRFRVRAKLPGAGPMEEVVREGLVEVHALTRNVLPVGHTFVKGVDLFDGHLVTSSTDANIPGRGPALQVTRTYSSSGSLDEGPLGAGWNLNYHSRLIVTSCFWTIVGGDGSGQRFVRLGGEFVPQKGYHTSLRENDDGSFDFFTKGRIRYHYVNVQFSADRPNLDFIEDTNGNRLQLTYDAAGNIAQVQEIFAGDVVGRSLFFEYVDVLGEPRISKITGPLGLELLYAYDEWANLTRVARAERVEIYEYSISQDLDRHNLTATVDSNDRRTDYVYYEDGDLFLGETGAVETRGKFEWVKEVHEAVGHPEEAVTAFLYDVTDFSATQRLKTVVTDARANDTEYLLNKDGSPVQITEPGNVVTVMEWASDDIMKLQETDALNRVTLFEYDANANLTKETIQAGGIIGDVVTEFEYDPTFNKMTLKRAHNTNDIQETRFEIDPANGNLQSTTDAENNAAEFFYFANGDLQSVRGPRPGQASSFDYDDFGNPTMSTDAEGNITTTVYDARSRLLSTSDTFGRSMTQAFDRLDRVTTVTREDASGSSAPATIVRTYYPGGQLKTERNALGLETTFTLDALNRVKQTTDTLGYSTSRSYDGNSNVLTSTDRRGVTSTSTYDPLNRLTKMDVSGPFGPPQTIATMDYDAVGNKLFETDLHGSRTEYGYDGLYRLTARKLPTDLQNHIERFTYDKLGNKLTEADANGNETSYQYDQLNRLTKRTDAVENVTERGYDEAGNQTTAHDVTRGLTTETDYDLLNRPLEQRVVGAAPNPFTYVTFYRYDDSAHTVTRTDPRGFETTTVLDGFDRVHRVEQKTGSDTLITTNYYDANGNLGTTRDAESRETNFTYDELNRLTRVDYPLSLETIFTYDGEGNKLGETNRRVLPTRFEYDNLGRLTRTEIDQPITGGATLTLSEVTYLDAVRKRTERDARGNSTTFEMDEQGRVTKITDALTQEQIFEYDAVNKTAEQDKRNLRTAFEYDDINRLTKITNALFQDFTTVHDDTARTSTETDRRNLVKTTQLDALGRLISTTRSGVLLEQHQYDGNNNRTISTDANTNQTQFTYDGANRLITRTDAFRTDQQTRTSFQYDRVGNLLEEKDGRLTGRPFDIKNTYDDLNRLTEVQDAEGNRTNFEYDGEGNRTAQIEPKSLAHRTEYDYGELNELIEVRMADGGRYLYNYDPTRNRNREEDAETNVVTYTYDALNRLDLMTQDPAGFAYVTNHDYDENGNETKLTDPKLQEINFEYDELNRLKKKIYALTPADFALLTRTHEITYHYDRNSNLVQIDELKSSGTDAPTIVSSFKTYDTLDRLQSETDAWARTLTYGYDPQGNRTSLTDPDSVQTQYTFDELNRLETLTLEAGTPAADRHLRLPPERPQEASRQPQRNDLDLQLRRRLPNDRHHPHGPHGRRERVQLHVRPKRQPHTTNRNQRWKDRDHPLRLRTNESAEDRHLRGGNGDGEPGQLHLRPSRQPAHRAGRCPPDLDRHKTPDQRLRRHQPPGNDR